MDRREAKGLSIFAAMLDGIRCPREVAAVETTAVKVIGDLHKTPWQRFVRLQRTAARLAQGRGQPKGVFRFSSHEACASWTANLNRRAK